MLGSVYLKRNLEAEVLELARFFPAVVIIGPRQVGKTSLTLAIRNQVDNASYYLDLERPEDLAAISNLEQYAEHNLDSLIILDEIQKMPELREVREALLLTHYENVIDDEEFLLLYDINKSENPDFPYWRYRRFELDCLNEDECVASFR